MQEEADQPEPDAGLAASLQNRRDALAQDASLRARRGALEQERAPPAVPLEREHLEELLSELEGLRDWVSRDVAWAAMQSVREARSLDAFISALQAEVSELGSEIVDEIAEAEGELAARATALAGERRRALEARAEELLGELEAAAPASFRARGNATVPPRKSPMLPRGAAVVVMGGDAGGAASAALTGALGAAGYAVRIGSDSCPAIFADPTLPASSSLRRELAEAEAVVLVCKGAAKGGLSPTFLTAIARVLPPRLRRVLVLGPRGVDRTLELGFVLRNALGGLDRQRAAEQAVATAAARVGAVCTVVHVEISAEAEVPSTPAAFAPASAAARPRRQALEAVLRDQAEARGRIAAGDALSGVVGAALAARAAREALRRPEAEGARFSLGTGGDGAGDGAGVGGGWDDEFLKLVGPEIARFGAAGVPVAWVRDWARALQSSPDGQGGALLSRFVVLDLPTAASLAAAKRGGGVSLPSGVRIRFLASGVEFVDEKEEARVKGDFDGAIDVYVEAGRVRMVRAEMEGVWRRGTDGSRRQVAPLVKVSSEARLLKKLEVDLREDGWLS